MDLDFKKPVTTNLKISLFQLAKENGIVLNEALEFGVKALLSDIQNGVDFPECILTKKLEKLMAKYEAKYKECEALREQIEPHEETAEKVIDEEAIKEGEDFFDDLKDSIVVEDKNETQS